MPYLLCHNSRNFLANATRCAGDEHRLALELTHCVVGGAETQGSDGGCFRSGSQSARYEGQKCENGDASSSTCRIDFQPAPFMLQFRYFACMKSMKSTNITACTGCVRSHPRPSLQYPIESTMFAPIHHTHIRKQSSEISFSFCLSLRSCLPTAHPSLNTSPAAALASLHRHSTSHARQPPASCRHQATGLLSPAVTPVDDKRHTPCFGRHSTHARTTAPPTWEMVHRASCCTHRGSVRPPSQHVREGLRVVLAQGGGHLGV